MDKETYKYSGFLHCNTFVNKFSKYLFLNINTKVREKNWHYFSEVKVRQSSGEKNCKELIAKIVEENS